MLGDSLVLHFDQGKNRTGAGFNYQLGGNGNGLSFGQIVTLGDFYSDQPNIASCQPQISDANLTDHQRCDLFQTVVSRLNSSYTQDPTTLDCILQVLHTSYADTQSAQDPAQAYAKGLSGIGGVTGWDAAWFVCTQAYLGTALCNADHFGEDAITAYTAGHTVALQYALKAQDNWDLLDAYFYEAFAQHYLSDLFSAGHIRTPRRTLHVDPAGFAFDYPPDDCNRYMHDEDSANGLWLGNLAGESWPIFGDKQAGASKSYWNRQQAIKAMQAGADELLQVFNTRNMILSADYAALRLIPLISLADQHQNFAPLFSFDSAAKQLNRRNTVDDRRDQSIVTYDANSLTKSEVWLPIKDAISSQGIITNMYPRTIQGWPTDLISETNMTQVRPVNSTHLLLNHYGPVWTRLFQAFPNQTAQRSWNMVQQNIVPHGIDISEGAIGWSWSELTSRQNELVVVAGYNKKGSFLLGLQQLAIGGSKPMWTTSQYGSMPCKLLPNAFHAIEAFAPGASVALVQYCESGSESLSPFFQVWTSQSSLLVTEPAFLTSFQVSKTQSRNTFAIFNTTLTSNTLVDIAYDPSTSANIWTFKRWSRGYLTEETATFSEPVSSAPSDLVYVQDSTDPANPRLLRISESSRTITVITVAFGSISSTIIKVADLTTPFNCDTKSYHLITNSATPNQPSLIKYCRLGDQIATTTFKYTSSSSSSSPTITFTGQNTIPPTYLQLFNGRFLTHITTRVVELYNIGTQRPYSPPRHGLLEAFDNYGILGARLLAVDPTRKDQVVWTPIGQYPAIAGQISDGLTGLRDGAGFMFD